LSTGHSLGGSLAALGAVSVKTALPSAALKLYTFGYSFSCNYFLPLLTPISIQANRGLETQNGLHSSNPQSARPIFSEVGAYILHPHDLDLIPVLAAVHTFDGVPTLIPRILGYEHQ
jgi:hypothetical protein